MAVLTAQPSVSTTAAALDQSYPSEASGRRSGVSVLVRNRGAVAVYLGDSAVSSAVGFQLDPGEAASIDIKGTERLYGRTASGTATVHVLQAG